MRTYETLENVLIGGRVHAPGESIELDEETAGPLLAVGAVADPEARPAEPVDGERAGIFEQALHALRAAPSGEVREFFRRMSEDPEIRAKLETEVDRQSQLIVAIAGLEEGNEAHWTNSGKPEVRALREATGLDDVSAAERDAAWEEFQKAKEAE